MSTVRIFFSSPGDVGEERNLGQQIITRLQAEFAGRMVIEPLFWEHEPLRATATFQAQIPHPSEMDIVVFILWSRLGTRLPAQFTRPDGSRYQSGTEYEFEDAVKGNRDKGTPDILVYRKSAEPVAVLDKSIMDRLAQKEALDDFIHRWFQDSDGSFTAAFHNFARPAEFEDLLEKHLRKLLQERLRGSGCDEESLPPAAWTGSPFRGLEDFGVEHSPIFFGRTQSISDILNALRKQAAQDHPFVLVMGMSGVGKSSLVKAGVLPNLTRPGVIENIGVWRQAIVRPSDTPEDLIKGLALGLLGKGALPELVADGTKAEELTQMLRETPKAIVPLIRAKLQQVADDVQRNEKLDNKPNARLAILLDQAEEIFTLPQITAADRTAWSAAVAALARSGQVWLLATLRSDFYTRCTELPEVLDLKEGVGQYDLRPPNAAEISQMIRQPARMAGLRFETSEETGERLDDVLRDAAMHSPEALPLLEFTLAELYDRKDPHGVLTLESYRQLGGLEGALGKRAESVFAGLDPATQVALPEVMGSLVAVGLAGDDTIARKRAPLAKVTATPEAQRLVNAFVAARLFVTEKDDNGTPVVQVAHEALLRHWPRIQEWLKKNQEGLSARARISAATALWKAEKRSPGFLMPPGEAVEEARQVLRERRHELDADEIQYIELSLAIADKKSKRRHESRLALVVAAALILLGIVAFLDGFILRRDSYYTAYVNRWGFPQGIGKISASDAAHRMFSYRFTRKGRFGHVIEIDAVDGYGHLTTNHNSSEYIESQSSESNRRECMWRFEYDDQGKAAEEKGLDKSGRDVFRFIFERKSDSSNVYIAKYSTNTQGVASLRAPSGASYVKFTRSPEGYDILTEFLALDGRTPVPNGDGIYGTKTTYNSAGLPVKADNLDVNGKPFRTKYGVASVEYTYDAKANQIRNCFFDEGGKPAWHSSGASCWEAKFDQYGNQVEQVYLGTDHRPVNLKSGYGIERDEYTSHGKPSAVSFFGFDSRPVVQNEGYHRAEYSYDDAGNLTEMRWMATDGRLRSDGIAITRNAYGPRGNVTLESYFNADNQPIASPGGYARLLRMYDAKDRVTSTLYADGAGWPTRSNIGAARTDDTYDDDGNVTSEVYFDFDGSPAAVNGMSKAFYKYDDRGNRILASFFKPDGHPGAIDSPCISLRYAYDEQGRQTEITCLDGSRNPIPDASGVTTTRTIYDAGGRVLESAHYASDGKSLVAARDGYTRVVHKYDDRGQVIETSYYDSQGKPTVPPSEGVFRLTQQYDTHGNEISVGFIGPDTRPVNVPVCNCAEVRKSFDDHGKLTEKEFLDARHQLVMHPAGGFARQAQKFDPNGDLIEESYFNTEGALVIPKNSDYARQVNRLDSAGRQLESAYYKPDGSMVERKGGYFIRRNQYDAHGNPTEVAYFDASGAPALNTEVGYAKVVHRYENDKQVETRTFLANGSPAVMTACNCSAFKRTYDSAGRLTSESEYGQKDEPVLDPLGYFSVHFKYDDKGNLTEVSYFSTDNRPVSPPQRGFARREIKYSPQGLPVEEATYGPDGKPEPDALGSVRLEHSYDAQGRVIEERRFAPDGKAPAGYGYSKAIFEYDASGLLLRKKFFDDRGAEVTGVVAIRMVSPGGQANALGLQPGDTLDSYDGRPIRYAYWLQNLVKDKTPRQHELIVSRNRQKASFQVKPGLLGIIMEEMTPQAAANLSAAASASSPPRGN